MRRTTRGAALRAFRLAFGLLLLSALGLEGMASAQGGGTGSGSSGQVVPALRSGVTQVPLGRVGQFLTVTVKVNGQGPFQFVMDTGAGGALHLTPELAQRLKLKQVGTILDGDPSGRGTVSLPLVEVSGFSLADTHFPALRAVVGGRLPGLQVDGVLGLGFFQGYTVTLDIPGRMLRLSKQPLSSATPHTVPYTVTPGGPEIEIKAGGELLKATLDSGGPGILSIPQASLVPLQGSPKVVARGRTATSEIEVLGATLQGDLVVAGWTLADPLVQVVPPLPVVSLESEFMQTFSIHFDTVNQLVKFEKP